MSRESSAGNACNWPSLAAASGSRKRRGQPKDGRSIIAVAGWPSILLGRWRRLFSQSQSRNAIPLCVEIPLLAEFGLYELMKRKLVQHRRRDLVLWENAALGSVAGGVAAALTTPLDVVKTRLMTQTNTAVADRYTGVVDALRRVYATEGPMALLSGIGPRVLWISVGGAIFIGSYEEFRRRLAPPRAPKVAGERE